MNTYGTLFKVTIYGESHGEACGVIIDGMTPGLSVNLDDLTSLLARRKSGKVGTTKRIESDMPIILSGVYNGFTTGSPINVMFKNENKISSDYNFIDVPRPGHADFVANKKYNGYNDERGGGHFSGRITLGVVAAGYFAGLLLPFSVSSKITQIGRLKMDECNLDDVTNYLEDITKKLDSVGGIVEVSCLPPIGLGEPFFDSVESKVASIFYSIPAVKAVEFGMGFKGINLLGSEFNDCFINEEGKTKTNNNGGINGGITNGNQILARVFVKPTPSIMAPQETFDYKNKTMTLLEIKGRHDVCIALRAQVVLECAMQIALADLYLMRNMK